MPVNNLNSDKIKIHSDEIDEIIATVPKWGLRWGSTFFLCSLVMVLFFAGVINYPDTIKAKLTITTANAPKALFARVSGRIEKMLVVQNQKVESGQPLAFMESSADHLQVLRLEMFLKAISLNVEHEMEVKNAFKERFDKLGELQSSYQEFYLSYINYQSTLQNGLYVKKKTNFKGDLANIKKQIRQLKDRLEIEINDQNLAKAELAMHKKLYDGKVETLSEFMQVQSRYLAKSSPVIQTRTEIIADSTALIDKTQQITDVKNQITEDNHKFGQSLDNLINRVNDWKMKYILIAPQSGKVYFSTNIQENQFVNSGQEVLYINPENDHFFGVINIPQYNMGNIRTDQEVLIKVNSFPYEEYGILRGRINQISDIPIRDSIFFTKVTFDPTQNFVHNKNIKLKTGMIADAEIITKNVTILRRIFKNVLSLAH